MKSISVSFLVLLCTIGLSSSGLGDELVVGGKTLGDWTKDLESENEIIRLRAVKSLGPFGKTALPALTNALADPSDGVQYWAADHIGKIGSKIKGFKQGKKVIDRLQEIAGQKSKAVSMAAAYALFQIQPDEAEYLNHLVSKLDHSERGTACSAAEFLGKIGPAAKSALPALEQKFRNHKDYHVRGACKNAIRKIKQEPVR